MNRGLVREMQFHNGAGGAEGAVQHSPAEEEKITGAPLDFFDARTLKIPPPPKKKKKKKKKNAKTVYLWHNIYDIPIWHIYTYLYIIYDISINDIYLWHIYTYLWNIYDISMTYLWNIYDISMTYWEPEGRYQYSKMFRWEPEGRYNCCTKSKAIAPFWFSTEHFGIVITPFLLSTDDIVQSTLPKSNSHKSNNRLSRRSIQVLFSSYMYSIVFNPS